MKGLKSENIICIYHEADLDGLCSAAIVKLKFPNAKLIGWDYGKPFKELKKLIRDYRNPLENVKDYHIIMVDVSIDFDDMQFLERNSKGLIWIDHHQKVLYDYFDNDNYNFAHVEYSILGKSACELCWDLFFKGASFNKVIHLLGRYDTWRKKEENNLTWYDVMAFQFGMNHPNNFNIPFIQKLILNHGKGSDYDKVYQLGATLRQYENERNLNLIELKSYERMLGDKVCLVINGRGDSSFWEKCFNNPDYANYNIFIGWRYDGEEYKFSLRANDDKTNVCEIAEKFGGGGHEKAAGFISDTHKIFDYEH